MMRFSSLSSWSHSALLRCAAALALTVALTAALGCGVAAEAELESSKNAAAKPPVAGILYLFSDSGEKAPTDDGSTFGSGGPQAGSVATLDNHYKALRQADNAMEGLWRQWQMLFPSPERVAAEKDFWTQRFEGMSGLDKLGGYPRFAVAAPADAQEFQKALQTAVTTVQQQTVTLCGQGFSSVRLVLGGVGAGAVAALEVARGLNPPAAASSSDDEATDSDPDSAAGADGAAAADAADPATTTTATQGGCALGSTVLLIATDGVRHSQRADSTIFVPTFPESYGEDVNNIVHVGSSDEDALLGDTTGEARPKKLETAKKKGAFRVVANEASQRRYEQQPAVIAALRQGLLQYSRDFESALDDESSDEPRNLAGRTIDFVAERVTLRRLLRWRMSLGWEQRELSKPIGVNVGTFQRWETSSFALDAPLQRKFSGNISNENLNILLQHQPLAESMQRSDKLAQSDRPWVDDRNGIMLPIPVGRCLANKNRTFCSFRERDLQILRVFFRLPDGVSERRSAETGYWPQNGFHVALGTVAAFTGIEANPSQITNSASRQKRRISMQSDQAMRLGMLWYLMVHLVLYGVDPNDTASCNGSGGAAASVLDHFRQTIVAPWMNFNNTPPGNRKATKPLSIEEYFKRYFLRGELSDGSKAPVWRSDRIKQTPLFGNADLDDIDQKVPDYLFAHPDRFLRWWYDEGGCQLYQGKSPDELMIPKLDGSRDCTPPEHGL